MGTGQAGVTELLKNSDSEWHGSTMATARRRRQRADSDSQWHGSTTASETLGDVLLCVQGALIDSASLAASS